MPWLVLEMTGKFGRLLALVVDDRYRSRGVGRRLVTAVEEQARAAGCVRLEVSSSRRRDSAYRFYQSIGYEDTCGVSARFIKVLTAPTSG